MSGLAIAFIILAIGFVGLLGLCFYTILQISDRLTDTQNALEKAIRERRAAQDAAANAWQAVDRYQVQLMSHPPKTDPRPTLIDQVIATETEELEAARGAMFRLRETMSNRLSAKSNGLGPLFSQNKPAVATRALETVLDDLGTDDLATVHAWLTQHPGQLDKLTD